MFKSILIGGLMALALVASPLWAAMEGNVGMQGDCNMTRMGGHGTSGHWNGMHARMHSGMHDSDPGRLDGNRNSAYPCEQQAPCPQYDPSEEARLPEGHAH